MPDTLGLGPRSHTSPTRFECLFVILREAGGKQRKAEDDEGSAQWVDAREPWAAWIKSG
jgi:hypothetical protein